MLPAQSAFRNDLISLLGLESHPPAPLGVEKVNSVEREAFIQEKLFLDAGEDVQAPLYLLIPKREPPYKPILVFHGHEPGGGATTLWLSALDERITTVVVSGYFSSFRNSLLAMEHCECNYVPGILELAEMGDIAALIAPRPFCAINSEEDGIFPAASASEQFKTVRRARAYEAHHTIHACQLSVHPGGHAYNNQVSRDWFDRQSPCEGLP